MEVVSPLETKKKYEMKAGPGLNRTYLHGLPEVVLEETAWELMVGMNSTMEDLNGAQPGGDADRENGSMEVAQEANIKGGARSIFDLGMRAGAGS
jgi:hypothetical protein